MEVHEVFKSFYSLHDVSATIIYHVISSFSATKGVLVYSGVVFLTRKEQEG